MSFSYVSVEDAIARRGLRMVVVGGVPSPWGEAAKGILHIKGIDWVAVRLAYDSEALKAWAGERSGPIAMYDDEPPRAGWREILELAERLAPDPPLLPAEPAARAEVLGLAHEICGRGRPQLDAPTAAGARGPERRRRLPRPRRRLPRQEIRPWRRRGRRCRRQGGDPARRLAARLKAQHWAGSPYFIGTALSAADVYAATAMALFRPLAADHCAMDAATRAAFETRDDVSDAALDPVLLAHRDMMYARAPRAAAVALRQRARLHGAPYAGAGAAGAYETATVTRRNVAWIRVRSALPLLFWLLNSASSSRCSSSALPFLVGGVEGVHGRSVVAAELVQERLGRAGEVEHEGVARERDRLARRCRPRRSARCTLASTPQVIGLMKPSGGGGE